jgi:hypothetical protein
MHFDLRQFLLPKTLHVQYKEAILAYAVLLKEDKGQVC